MTIVAEFMTQAGYRPFNTGGDVMAWRKETGNGGYLLLCHIDGGTGDDCDADAQIWTNGVYGPDDCETEVTEPVSLITAVAYGEQFCGSVQ